MDHSPPLSVRLFGSLGLSTFTLLFVGVALSHYAPTYRMAVESETAPIAWLNTFLLAIAAGGLLQRAVWRPKDRWAFVIGAMGASTAALDEWFMGHERIKQWIMWTFYEGNYPAMGIVGDVPMFVYPIGALAFVVGIWRLLDRFGRGALLAAYAFGFTAVFLDVFFEPSRVLLVEELAETGSALSFCLLAILGGSSGRQLFST